MIFVFSQVQGICKERWKLQWPRSRYIIFENNAKWKNSIDRTSWKLVRKFIAQHAANFIYSNETYEQEYGHDGLSTHAGFATSTNSRTVEGQNVRRRG